MVQVTRACPEISKKEALDLITDLDGPVDRANITAVQAKKGTTGTMSAVQAKKGTVETMWLERLLEDHPVFEGLLQHLKASLLDTPARVWTRLGINRRIRNALRNGKCAAIVRLQAGPEVASPSRGR